ncbi:MAG TPA: hypothetical protein VG935_03055, partial [Patescibacteria group bacterium]|nr:hypothetical protein [Patescibacteria group bacterium]
FVAAFDDEEDDDKVAPIPLPIGGGEGELGPDITPKVDKGQRKLALKIALGVALGLAVVGGGERILDNNPGPTLDNTPPPSGLVDMAANPSPSPSPTETSYATPRAETPVVENNTQPEAKPTNPESEEDQRIDTLLGIKTVDLTIEDGGSISNSWQDQEGKSPKDYKEQYYNNYQVTTADVLNDWDELQTAWQAKGGMPVSLNDYMTLVNKANEGDQSSQLQLTTLNQRMLDQQQPGQVFQDFATPKNAIRFYELMLGEYKKGPKHFAEFEKKYQTAKKKNAGSFMVSDNVQATGDRAPIPDFTVTGADGKPVQVTVSDAPFNANGASGESVGGDTQSETIGAAPTLSQSENNAAVVGDGTGGPSPVGESDDTLTGSQSVAPATGDASAAAAVGEAPLKQKTPFWRRIFGGGS